MEITGTIIKVLPFKKGTSKTTGKDWQTQDVVIEIPNEQNPQYPEHLVINIFGEEKISQYNLKEGMQVKAFFNFAAREWKGAWFNALSAYRFESIGSIPTNTSSNASVEQPKTTTQQTDDNDFLDF